MASRTVKEKIRSMACTAGLLLLALVALDVRCAGIFRGLDTGFIYHSDEAKQTVALANYLRGRYLWYQGSWLYDGYPYGLNHIDEYILRCVRPIKAAVVKFAMPDYQEPLLESRFTLYYEARVLRVLYSMVALLCTVGAATLLCERRKDAVWVALLCAVAPLSATVTHCATGDVGTDLFAALALLMLSMHAKRSRMPWLVASGVMVGFAFSCKYNGMLAGLLLAVYALLCAARDRRLGSLFRIGCWSGGGAALGVLLGTPALWIRWHQTWKDILINFHKIRCYHVTDEWLAQPWASRTFHTIAQNMPVIGSALGWAILVGAVVAVMLLGREWWTLRSSPSSTGMDRTMEGRLAVAVFPLLSLAISILGKPSVQPFHFSYLVGPLILGWVFAVSSLVQSSQSVKRYSGNVLLLVALLESGVRTEREHFFWKRDESGQITRTFVETVMQPAEGSFGPCIKTCDLEKDPEKKAGSMSVFRNRSRMVLASDGAFWNQLGTVPLPSVPFPRDLDWIFMNGPVFPRNDRSFRVVAGESRSKYLVYHAKPGALHIGIRSGIWPTWVTVAAGDTSVACSLGAHSETNLVLVPRVTRRSKGVGPDGEDVFFCPISVEAGMGDAWITVAQSDREWTTYRLFGPNGDAVETNALAWIRADDVSIQALSRVKLLDDGMEPMEVVNAGDMRILSPEGTCQFIDVGNGIHPELGKGNASSSLRSFAARSVALPAGAYVLDCDVVGMGPSADVVLGVRDVSGLGGVTPGEQQFNIVPGLQHIRYRFIKTFAPYQCVITLRGKTGQAIVKSWALTPDVERTLNAIVGWRDKGKTPAWFCSGTQSPDGPLQHVDMDATFGNGIHLRDVEMSSKNMAGGTLMFRPGLELTRDMGSSFGDLDLFVHLVDPKGVAVLNSGFVLFDGMANVALGRAMCLPIPSNVHPGTYGVEMGIWNRESLKRLHAEVRSGPITVRGNALHVGVCEVAAPTPVAEADSTVKSR